MIGYEVKDDLRLVKVKRLLGLPIYEKKRTDSRLERSFLGGLYRESVRFADFGEASRQSWLLGLPLWGRTLLGHRLRWHIGRSLVVNSFDILSVLSRDLDRLFASVFGCGASTAKACLRILGQFRRNCFAAGLFLRETHSGARIVRAGRRGGFVHQEIPSRNALFPVSRIRSVVAKPRVLRHLTDDADAGDWAHPDVLPGPLLRAVGIHDAPPRRAGEFLHLDAGLFGVKKTIVGFLLPAARIRNGWLQSFLPRYKNWMFPVKT